MISFHPWFDAATAQQDFAWFLCWLGWFGAVVCFFYRWNRRDRIAWGWGLVAGGQMIVATVAILQHASRPVIEMAPARGWDVAVAAGIWIQGLGLLWRSGGTRSSDRWSGAAALLLAFALGLQLNQAVIPGREQSLLGGFGAMVIFGAVVWRMARKFPAESGVAFMVLLSLVAEPHGPLADLAHEARRWVPLSLFAVPSALLSILAGILAIRLSLHVPAGTEGYRANLRSFVWRVCACIAAGLTIAEVMGWLARRDFENGLIARARVFATVVDIDTLSHWMRTRYIPGPPRDNRQFYGGRVQMYIMPSINDPEILPLRQKMAALTKADPLLSFVHVATLRKGEILSAVHAPAQTGPKDVIIRHRPATDRDYEAWGDRRAYFSPPFMSSWGSLVRAWMPLADHDGRMLGWLTVDASVPSWTVVQAQARLQAFALTTLGIVLLVLAERHRLRSAERLAARAEAAAAKAAGEAKTAFLAQVSHEFRTPLQSILGYGELLSSTPLSDEQHRWLKCLGAQGTLLNRLVEDMLDLTSLQTGGFRVRPKAGDLASTVTAAVEALRPSADRRRLRLIFSISGPTTANLVFDDARVRQVAQNLVTNAIKFTDVGEVEVSLLTAENTGRPDEMVDCELRVRDTGCGIPPEEQSRLFRPFARLERTAHRDGAGLGLTLCRSISQAMGGDVEVESDGETGSTFIAKWKLARALSEVKALEGPVASAGQLEGLRVLVADDNPFVRALFREYLTSRGADVELVCDGEAALACCLAKPFSVVLLDVAMPRLDGYATAKRLRATHPTLHIVGVSAHADALAGEQATAAGMNVFLHKPVGLDALVAAVYPDTVPVIRAGSGDDSKMEALRARLRTQFITEIVGQVARLATHVAAADWPDVVRQAHYLKNGADVVQLPALAAACLSIQFEAEQARREETIAALRQLEHEVERAQDDYFSSPSRAKQKP